VLIDWRTTDFVFLISDISFSSLTVSALSNAISPVPRHMWTPWFLCLIGGLRRVYWIRASSRYLLRMLRIRKMLRLKFMLFRKYVCCNSSKPCLQTTPLKKTILLPVMLKPISYPYRIHIINYLIIPQAGVVDVFPDEVKCAHDNNTVGDVRLNLNVKGAK
jgi:hypothetical protein